MSKSDELAEFCQQANDDRPAVDWWVAILDREGDRIKDPHPCPDHPHDSRAWMVRGSVVREDCTGAWAVDFLGAQKP